MTATIYSYKTPIGTADLQVGDKSMGSVFGLFIPNENYFKDIQKNVWEFNTTNKPDYKKWQALRFNVRLDNGYFLFPLGGYTIDDVPDFSNEPKRIDIAGIDLRVLDYTADSLLKPWSKIGIEQKISFEDELKEEITPVKSLIESLPFKGKDNHTLAGAEVSACAKYGPNDDVLFEIHKEDEAARFAVVHLTWTKRKKEHSGFYPVTHFYQDFNDFVEKRLKPDNIEWNA